MQKQLNRTPPELSRTYQIVKKTLIDNENKFLLSKTWHSIYVYNSLIKIGPSIYGYDFGHTWLLYYIELSLALINDKEHNINQGDIKQKIIKMLSYCKQEGFGGGHGQIPHLATTYAAFLAILILGKQAYTLLDRDSLYKFFKQRKQGSKFHMHQHGESDLRGIYIVVIIAKLLKMNEDIYDGLVQQIVSCQTYEGGLTNIAGGEAHGGYTFCGVAALAIMGKLEKLDISRLMFWLVNRQVKDLGGFSGRTNKLIDSCYSFWVGSTFNVINDYFKGEMEIQKKLLYCQDQLQQYLIKCCQDAKGGLFDKPEKSRDLYHTAYSLAGLSLSQHNDIFYDKVDNNRLTKLDPIYNVPVECLQEAKQYYGN